MFDILAREFTSGFPDGVWLARALIRMLAALLLGALIGYQREVARKTAGLRTHMLVSIGTCFLVFVPLEAGFDMEIGRVIQGIAAGIGFIGGGAILKHGSENAIHGVTTAASLWATAAVGVAAGMGRIGTAMIATVLIWFILAIVWRLEPKPHKP